MDVTLIVDGANVMGSRADGWWRDRAGAMARLHGELAALAARGITGPVPGGPTAGGATAGGATAGGATAGGATAGGATAGGATAGGATAGGATAGGPADGGAADGGAADGGDEPGGRWFPQVVLVVEGRARAVTGLVEPDPGVRVVAARGEGDDEIAGLAGQLSGPRVVVTADRELRRRCEAAGAAVTGPGWLLRQFG